MQTKFKKKNILFYTPFNARSRDNESLMFKFKELGHQVYFMTQNEGTSIRDILERGGISTYKTNLPLHSKTDILKNIFFLAWFVKKYKIDIIFSHLEPSNLIAVFVKFITRAKIIIVRHHTDMFHLNNLDSSLAYRLTYRLSRHIIAVSEVSKEFMIAHEKVKRERITVINLAYNFDLFDKPDEKKVIEIRKNHKGLLLVTAGRLVGIKRFPLAIEVVNQLNKRSIEAYLLIVGEGEIYEELEALIKETKLSAYCSLVGYKENIMDYLEACDILLHPSASESSSVIIKEAGVRKKPVIVCKGVGDFDDYLVHGVNGYLTEKNNFVEEAVSIISDELADRAKREEVGQNLYKTVKSRFDVDKIIYEYNQLIY